MIIIELNDGLKDDTSAKINKMVTMFPKSNVDEYIDKIGSKKVYYLNKGNVVKEKAQFRALGNEYQYRHTGLNCILYRSKMYLFMGPVFSSTSVSRRLDYKRSYTAYFYASNFDQLIILYIRK